MAKSQEKTHPRHVKTRQEWAFIHPSGFEPLTFGSVGRFARDVSTCPCNYLRQFQKNSAAPQQHIGDDACQKMATSDTNDPANAPENEPRIGDDFQSLGRLIAAWPTLPAHARTTILQIADVLSVPPIT